MSKMTLTDESLPSPATSTELASGRKRVSKPKTRTGCFTCKIRRVKCDEKKPECERCTKFGTKCDGYPRLQRGTAEAKTPPLKIRPWLGPKPRDLNSPSRASLCQPPPSLIVRSETEEHYLQVFRKDVIPELSSICNNSFWDSIVLTACHEPFIQDGVLAIAAISLSIKEDRRKLLTLGDGAGNSEASAKHYRFALERFGRAVRAMRSTLTNDEQHLRKALIGCLLVFCFEGFQGYPKQALVHVISGYHLLQSWLIKKSYPLVLPNSTPPASRLIEKELMDAFHRLHANAVTVMGDSCSMEAYALEQASGERVLQHMPSRFADFGEAHRYFIHIMKGVAVFIQLAVGLPLDPSSSSNEQQDQAQSTFIMNWGASIHTPFPIAPVPTHILKAYRKHINELLQWQCAFNPLHLSTNPANQVGVTVLQAGWTGLCMVANIGIARSECYWDQFLPECRAIISLAKKLFRILPREQSLAQKGGFSLDISILPPLYMVCKYCRDGQLRREALTLMNRCPRRDGVWHSGLISKVSTILMEFEEEGLVGGYIPEYARARITKLAVDVLNKTAEVECTKRISGIEGGFEVRKKKIEWD